LTKPGEEVNNEDMKRVLGYFLSHLCCLLIALPIGWCCWLPTAHAQEETAKPKCCCCGEQEAPKPSKPVPPSKAPPNCCEPMPAALADSSQKDVQDQVGLAYLPANFLPLMHDFRAFESGASPTAWFEDSLSFQVLYCNWRC